MLGDAILKDSGSYLSFLLEKGFFLKDLFSENKTKEENQKEIKKFILREVSSSGYLYEKEHNKQQGKEDQLLALLKKESPEYMRDIFSISPGEQSLLKQALLTLKDTNFLEFILSCEGNGILKSSSDGNLLVEIESEMESDLLFFNKTRRAKIVFNFLLKHATPDYINHALQTFKSLLNENPVKSRREQLNKLISALEAQQPLNIPAPKSLAEIKLEKQKEYEADKNYRDLLKPYITILQNTINSQPVINQEKIPDIKKSPIIPPSNQSNTKPVAPNKSANESYTKSPSPHRFRDIALSILTGLLVIPAIIILVRYFMRSRSKLGKEQTPEKSTSTPSSFTKFYEQDAFNLCRHPIQFFTKEAKSTSEGSSEKNNLSNRANPQL